MHRDNDSPWGDDYDSNLTSEELRQNNEKKRGIKKTAVGLGKYVFSPYVFSAKDMNPFRDLSHPLRSMFAAIKRRRKVKFKTLDEVLDDNPQFEVSRSHALKKLKRRRTMNILVALVWFTFNVLGEFKPFDFNWQNTIAVWMFSIFLVCFICVTDLTYLVFKYRLLKLTPLGWIGIRSGYTKPE